MANIRRIYGKLCNVYTTFLLGRVVAEKKLKVLLTFYTIYRCNELNGRRKMLGNPAFILPGVTV